MKVRPYAVTYAAITDDSFLLKYNNATPHTNPPPTFKSAENMLKIETRTASMLSWLKSDRTFLGRTVSQSIAARPVPTLRRMHSLKIK